MTQSPGKRPLTAEPTENTSPTPSYPPTAGTCGLTGYTPTAPSAFDFKNHNKTLPIFRAKNLFIISFFKEQSLATIPFNIFLLDINFDKFTIGLHFFSYILHACKISSRLKITSYDINQIFKFQVFVI